MTSLNKYNYNRWVESGCPKNDNIKLLNCNDNNLDSLVGIKNLPNLMELHCSWNQLDSLIGIENFANLKLLNCSNNKLNSLVEIKNFTKVMRTFN